MLSFAPRPFYCWCLPGMKKDALCSAGRGTMITCNVGHGQAAVKCCLFDVSVLDDGSVSTKHTDVHEYIQRQSYRCSCKGTHNSTQLLFRADMEDRWGEDSFLETQLKWNESCLIINNWHPGSIQIFLECAFEPVSKAKDRTTSHWSVLPLFTNVTWIIWP